MNEQIAVNRLEVPSDITVNVPRLKEFLALLPTLGREFTRDAVEKNPRAPPKSAIPRILGYLKYLDLLVENRLKAEKPDAEPVQKFTLTEAGRTMYYNLESGRTEKFGEIWTAHLRAHPVFQVVFQHKLSDHPTLTLNELQDLVYEAKGRVVSVSFARHGAEFLAELLDDAGLVKYSPKDQKLTLVPPTSEAPALTTPAEATTPLDATPQGTANGTLFTAHGQGTTPATSFEEYRSGEIYVRLNPSRKNIVKVRKFLDLVEISLEEGP